MKTLCGSTRCVLPIEQRFQALKEDEQSPVALAREGAMISARTHTFTPLHDEEDVSFLKMHGILVEVASKA